MAAIPGGVIVTGFISPSDTADVYATHDALYGKGGRRSVADNATRDAIPALRRTDGMTVFTIDSRKTWELQTDLTSWVEVAGIPPLTDSQIFVGNGSNVATSVAFTLSASGGGFSLANTGVLTMPNAATGTRGLLTSTDWNTFNNKAGSSLYTGNGTIPTTTVATITDTLEFAGGSIYNYGGGGIVSNTAFGDNALIANATGQYITAYGFESGKSTSTVNGSSFFGYQSGINVTSAENTLIGYLTASLGVLGTNNTFVGSRSGAGNGSATGNVGVGYNTLAANVSGAQNIVIGFNGISQGALTGGDNIVLGAYAVYNSATSANGNICIGYASGNNLSSGARNILLGYSSGRYIGTNSNYFIVNNQDNTNTAGDLSESLLVGVMAATPSAQTLAINAAVTSQTYDSSNYYTTTVSSAGLVSYAATGGGGGKFEFLSEVYYKGAGNATGSTAYGTGALDAGLSGGTYNTAYGNNALGSVTNGVQNAAFGSGALGQLTGNYYNAAFGTSCLANATGTYNTGVGNGAAITMAAGEYNVYIGGENSAAITSSSYNTIIGARANFANTTGNYNVLLGYESGRYGTFSDTFIVHNSKGVVDATTQGTNSLIVGTFNANALSQTLKVNASLIIGSAALATTATDGFLYIPACAGTPTGTPTAQTGTVPMVYDTTNDKFYIYNGSWLGGTNPGAFT